MKTISLLIFVTIFCQVTAKVFLVTLDKERGTKWHDESDILEKGREEKTEKMGKETKGFELKSTFDDEASHVHSRAASDYSNQVADTFFSSF